MQDGAMQAQTGGTTFGMLDDEDGNAPWGKAETYVAPWTDGLVDGMDSDSESSVSDYSAYDSDTSSMSGPSAWTNQNDHTGSWQHDPFVGGAEGEAWDLEMPSSDTETVSVPGSDLEEPYWAGPDPQFIGSGTPQDHQSQRHDMSYADHVHRSGMHAIKREQQSGAVITSTMPWRGQPQGAVVLPRPTPLATVPPPMVGMMAPRPSPAAPEPEEGPPTGAQAAPRRRTQRAPAPARSKEIKQPMAASIPQLTAVASPRPEGMKSPGECPHCLRSAYCELTDAPTEGGALVGGGSGVKAGRCKARDNPRKDNRLGMWYRKYGYDGDPYCKACSESFKSHLVQQKTRPRCGCTRAQPCADCAKVLAGFGTKTPKQVFQKFDDEKEQRSAAAPAPKGGKRAGGGRDSRVTKTRKMLGGAAVAVLFVTCVFLSNHLQWSEAAPSSSLDQHMVTQCLDDEVARAKANPFSDPTMPFSKTCVEIARNGYCDIQAYIELGVRDFCCESCDTVKQLWVCPAMATQELLSDFVKEPTAVVPGNQAGSQLEDDQTYKYCQSSPMTSTTTCSFMSGDSDSSALCFACTGTQAMMHGATCQGSPDYRVGDMPYGWTCRCDGCVVANSGRCVSGAYMQASIDEFEAAMNMRDDNGGSVPDGSDKHDTAHVIGGGDSISDGNVPYDHPTPEPAPAQTNPHSHDAGNGGSALPPAWLTGGLEPPQGEILMADGSEAMAYTIEQQQRLHVDVWGTPLGGDPVADALGDNTPARSHYGNPVATTPLVNPPPLIRGPGGFIVPGGTGLAQTGSTDTLEGGGA